MNQSSDSSAPLRPVYLVTSEDGGAAEGGAVIGSGEVLTAGAVALAVVLVVIVAGRVRRRLDAARPAEDVALRGICRRLRLGGADRSALAALASATIEGWPQRVHPVALLVSRGAFETAAAACVREGAVSAAAVNRIRRRAFRG